MARRKRVMDDSDDSDDSDISDVDDLDPDAREERALFKDPYKHNKRRKRGGKEDAIYGVFRDDSDDEPRRTGKKSDWAKAPAFVSGEKKVDLEEDADVDEGNGDSDSDVDNDDDVNDDMAEIDEQEVTEEALPAMDEDDGGEETERTLGGGIGFNKSSHSGLGFSKSSGKGLGFAKSQASSGTGLGFSKASSSGAGLGFSKASSSSGLGFSASSAPSTGPSTPVPDSNDDTPPPPSAPSAFGKKPAFQPPPKPAVLSSAEAAHFAKLSGSFGARMLSKMGWSAGMGLGTEGAGIVTPIESKLRPQKMGIAFKGFSEKTEQSKREAKRKGLDVSDEEDKTPAGRKAKELKEKRKEAWKKPKKAKVKIQHKTYEEIIAEAGEEAPPAGVGVIIDATGATPREISSLANISLDTWTPTGDLTRIPEVRHNLRIIVDACKSELDGLGREGKALEERKRWINNEELRAAKKVAEEADLISRLQKVNLVAGEISLKSRELASQYEVSLDPFSPFIYQLSDQYSKEIDMYNLDEVVVAAITPLVRRMVSNWNPLEDPTLFVSTFRNWKRVLKMSSGDEEPQDQLDIYGSTRVTAPKVIKPMTPFESLLWNVILPKFRTSVNNEWSPSDPRPAVKLYEAWSTFLPPFIRDNFLDQLIIPKVHKAVADWKPRKDGVSLQTFVFPWLPHLGLRLEGFLDDARRKIKSLLRNWTIDDAVPEKLVEWRDVFGLEKWDEMILKYVVPKLGATMRDDFQINPREQDMRPLERVLQWSTIIRSSITSQLLEAHFFPKWLDVLHIWLIQPGVNFEEVSQWYSFWKGVFPEEVQNLTGVQLGFTRGLQLMNKAIELGPEKRSSLPKPEHHPPSSAPGAKPAVTATTTKKPSARTHEITFREIVEEFAGTHDLLFIPTGKAHEKSRVPLFRVSRTADGKTGLLVYVLDDAVWAPPVGEGHDPTKEFRAISLEDMVLRASTS